MSGIMFADYLQMFADGGAGGDGGGATGTAGAAGAAAQAQGAGAQTNKAAGKPENLNDVVYGRQAADGIQDGVKDAAQNDAGKQAEQDRTNQPQQPAKKPSFDELLQDPDYKKEFQQRFDKQFNRRFAENKQQQENWRELAPALNLLAGKYGTEPGDLKSLISAINEDNDLIERQAYDKGMEPDAYREYNRMLAENQALKEAEAQRQRQAKVDSQYNAWLQQAEQARAIYPNLNLQQEVKNPQFAQLLGAGIDVGTAYQVVHMNELSTQLVQRAAADGKASAVRAIQANSGRPRENGSAPQKAATVKSDATKLKARDFDEIIRRAARGDSIRF